MILFMSSDHLFLHSRYHALVPSKSFFNKSEVLSSWISHILSLSSTSFVKCGFCSQYKSQSGVRWLAFPLPIFAFWKFITYELLYQWWQVMEVKQEPHNTKVMIIHVCTYLLIDVFCFPVILPWKKMIFQMGNGFVMNAKQFPKR